MGPDDGSAAITQTGDPPTAEKTNFGLSAGKQGKHESYCVAIGELDYSSSCRQHSNTCAWGRKSASSPFLPRVGRDHVRKIKREVNIPSLSAGRSVIRHN